MTRGMTTAMETEAQASENMPVFFIRLNIETDPVIMWTGYGDYTPSGTGDVAFDGFTFVGLGNIGEISTMRDTDNGSGPVTLTLPGVDLQDTALKEIIYDARKWQWKKAWVWFGYLNTSLGVVVKPTRMKTGRIDTLEASVRKGEGVVTLVVESHQANISQAQDKRMVDQQNIDPTDTSMDFIYDLANKTAGAGVEARLVSRGLSERVGFERVVSK